MTVAFQRIASFDRELMRREAWRALLGFLDVLEPAKQSNADAPAALFGPANQIGQIAPGVAQISLNRQPHSGRLCKLFLFKERPEYLKRKRLKRVLFHIDGYGGIEPRCFAQDRT